MFEGTPPVPGSIAGAIPVADAPFGTRAGERGALRAIGWPELTARINAARDLRRVLRHDAIVGATSFSDAAAGYFSSEIETHEQGKLAVNPDALGHGKSSGGTAGPTEGEAATGDQES